MPRLYPAPESRPLFPGRENAHVVEANDAEQIADRIVRILGHPEETARITRGGQLLNREAFNYLNHAPALADFSVGSRRRRK
ncbi:MAG: glycosyltransferase [Alistipes sp.]